MRILFLCNEYPPTLHGGIGTFTRELTEGLVSAGHEVTVWGFYNIESSIHERINGVDVIRQKFSSPQSFLGNLWFLLNFNVQIRKFLWTHKFDIVECQEWLGLIPFGLSHPGYVVRLHGASIFFDVLLNRRGSRLTHFLEKKMLRNAKHLVAVSNYCGNKTLNICGLERPFKVIYNGVNKKMLSSYKLGSTNPYQIVFANSVLPKKGILELVKAFEIISEKYPLTTLTIVGKLKAKIDGVDIQNVILDQVPARLQSKIFFTGWLNHFSEVYKLLAGAHVCCYPSHMEGFGIAPVEAMALGKPVIFMDDGPGPEVIEHGVSGILVDTKDPTCIAEGICAIFGDDFSAQKLGHEAELRVSRLFDLGTCTIPNNISFYKELLEHNMNG